MCSSSLHAGVGGAGCLLPQRVPARVKNKRHPHVACRVLKLARGWLEISYSPMIACIRHLPAQEKNPLSVDVGVGCVLLDELAAWFHVFAHKHREHAVGLGGIVNLHLLENAVLGVHGCFP